MNKNHIEQLDVFRALAALSVCAVHFNYDSIFHNYFAEGLFVQLFFTLSGFVISLNYHNNIKRFLDLKNFLIKRFKRLNPLHLFFLLIFLMIEILKYILYTKYNIQANSQAFEINNLKNFFLNLFFIQHLAERYNFNSVSWSISVEMMLYISFGLMVLINKKYLIYLSIIYIITFLLFFNSFYGAALSMKAYYSGLYSFLIGYLFCIIFQKKKIDPNNYYFNIIYYVFIFIFLIEIFYFKSIQQKYIYSIIFALVFYFSCFLNKKLFLFKLFFNKYLIFLGKISYSIYLSHLFVFFILNNVLKYVLKKPIMLKHDGATILQLDKFDAHFYTILAYLITISVSYFAYNYIEMKFYKK